METSWNNALWRQFDIAIATLEDALVACPDALWTQRLWRVPPADPIPPGFAEFWHVAYHTLFWLDLYLTGSREEEFAPPAPFTWVELAPVWVLPARPYTKAVKPTMWSKQTDKPKLEFQPSLHAFTKLKPTTWLKQTDYLELEFQPSLEAFTTQRADLLAVLEALAPEDWSRAATITGGGKPREESVFSFARRLALHERPHVKQIERIVNMLNE